MDILLIHVPRENGKKISDKSLTFEKSINFGLLSVASFLKKHEYNAKLIDIRASDTDEDIISLIDKYCYSIPTAIGFSCISGFALPTLISYSKQIKEHLPQSVQIVGGKDFCGIVPNEILRRAPHISIVVKGESETILPILVTTIQSHQSINKIPNIVYRANNGEIITTDTINNYNLFEIPTLDYNIYPSIQRFAPSVEVSRGCPSNCLFCINNRTRVRKKLIKNIVKESAQLVELHNNNELCFYYETPFFMLTKKEINELIQLRKQNDLAYTWRTETRVEYLNQENMELLKRAGLRVVDLGLESGSPAMLRMMHKTKTPRYYLQQAENILKIAYDLKILIKINILFFVGETKQTILETIEFLEKNSKYINALSAYPLLLYPGIDHKGEIFKVLMKYGGNVEENDLTRKTLLKQVNPSANISYQFLAELGILLGKGYQSAETFFYQKKYGYYSPGTTFADFQKAVQINGIEKYPFSYTSSEMINYRKKAKNLVMQL